MRMCQASDSVHSSWARDSQQHAWLTGKKPGRCCSIAGCLLISEAEEPDALRLPAASPLLEPRSAQLDGTEHDLHQLMQRGMRKHAMTRQACRNYKILENRMTPGKPLKGKRASFCTAGSQAAKWWPVYMCVCVRQRIPHT